MHGGQTIKVDAPIDTLPLFVRAGSIVPVGERVENTSVKQGLAKVLVYAGADADFSLYDDDGRTYGYEKGAMTVTHLHWDDGAGKMSGVDAGKVEVVGR